MYHQKLKKLAVQGETEQQAKTVSQPHANHQANLCSTTTETIFRFTIVPYMLSLFKLMITQSKDSD